MIIAIIPARGGSKRLKRKNLRKVLGKPMIQWAIEACKNASSIKAIFVSTEDKEIADFSKSMGVNVINRPEELSQDDVWTQDVLKHAIRYIAPTLQNLGVESIDTVVRIQANSPQVTGAKIDQCVEKLYKNNLWEVFTVDKQGIEDAAIHVMRTPCVFQNALSVYKGVVETDYIDIHTEKDLKRVEISMKIKNFFDDEDDLLDKQIIGNISEIAREMKSDNAQGVIGWRTNKPVLETYRTLLEKSNTKDLEKLYSNKESKKLKKVLDLGCGFCPFWPFLEKKGFSEFVGVDLFSLRGSEISGSKSHLEMTERLVSKVCGKSIKTRIIEADVRDIEDHIDPNEKFDLIFTSNTDYTKKGSTGIPYELFDEICKKYLSSNGIKIYNG